MWFFYYFDFKINYDVLKSKSPWLFLNKNINVNKDETELKMENPTHNFKETNLVLQLIKESQIKSKTVMSWSLQKIKDVIFGTVYFVWREFCNICILAQCIVYWIRFQNIYTFTYQKTVLDTLFLLVIKVFESLQFIFNSWLTIANLMSDKIKILVLELQPKCFRPVRLQDSLKCNISRKNLGIRLIFCLWINIRVSYKLVLSLMVGIVRHVHRTKYNKLAIPL